MVPMYAKRLFIIYLSSVYRWFADKIGLCVALALYLWECRHCIWLYDHKLLLVSV
jgi:hypothetical protein